MVKLLGIAWTRIRTNMRDPLIRRNVAFFMGGKLIGLALVLVAMWVFLPSVVHAMNRGASVDMPTINAVNTVWTLVAAFLVFCMQVGFVMLEAGFARSREAVNILVEGIADTCICGILFWAWGFGFMFMSGTPVIGTSGFFGDLLYSVGVTGFIYPIIGHWAWGPDGWLAVMQPIGFRDFAGSTVVHTIGGVISLAGAIVLGPRLGRVF